MDSKDIVFNDDDTFGMVDDDSNDFLSDDSESSVTDDGLPLDDVDDKENSVSDDKKNSDKGENKPFFKTQNGILAIAGVVGFMCYAGYTFLGSSEMDNGSSMSLMQPPAQNVTPLNKKNISSNVAQPMAQVDSNKDVSLADVSSLSGNFNNDVTAPDPRYDNPTKKAAQPEAETDSLNKSSLNAVDIEKSPSKDNLLTLKEKVKELSLKIDSLTASLMASYEIIDGNLKSINKYKEASSEKIDKITSLIEEGGKVEAKHYKSLTWRLVRLNKSIKVSKKTSVSHKSSKKASLGKRIKNLKLTSVVNGTGWVRDSKGRNLRLSVGDKFKGKVKVSDVLYDKIVLSNGDYILN